MIMKKVLSILAVCMAASMSLSLCACGQNASSDSTATTAASTKATVATAASTKVDSKQSDVAASSAVSGSEQSETTAKGQTDDSEQQKAIQKATENAASLYGEGDWRVASIQETVDSNGSPCYRVGLINYSNSQSPTYYFLSSSTFCYPDTSNEGNGSENQQDDSSQQHAIQGVISLANQMYGEGDWRIASVIDATTPSGEACWYIGAINYSKSQSPTYYFYSSDSFTYADEEVNGYYNN